MARRSVLLLPNTLDKTNVTGEKVRVDSFFGQPGKLHTIAIHVSNFRGRVSIQASLAVDPSEADWATIPLNGAPYIEYPRSALPTLYLGETSATYYNFRGNYLWLRAVMTRDYLGSALNVTSPSFLPLFGLVDRVLLNT